MAVEISAEPATSITSARTEPVSTSPGAATAIAIRARTVRTVLRIVVVPVARIVRAAPARSRPATGRNAEMTVAAVRVERAQRVRAAMLGNAW